MPVLRHPAAQFERLLNDALPQTQCTRCGYPDCAAYAHAIAAQLVPINRCPPGGAEGVSRLARITGTPVLALDPECGVEAPRAMAVIDEDWCIGCTLCLDACPTDAIVGSHKVMHTVMAEHCTGCELCLPVCPVDCIAMENASGTTTGWAAWSAPQAQHAQERYATRTQRLARAIVSHAPAYAPSEAVAINSKNAIIAAALARAKAKRAP